MVGGELGGPKPCKVISGVLLIFLWLTYIFMSIMKVYNLLIFACEEGDENCE